MKKFTFFFLFSASIFLNALKFYYPDKNIEWKEFMSLLFESL